jgi:hypothetical protein
MVNPSWKDDHVVLLELDPNPVIVLAPHVKVSLAASNVADLLILVKMLIEEHFDLVLVDIAHLLRRDDDLVAVLVATLLCHLVHTIELGKTVIEDAQLLQSVDIDLAPRIVGQPLVTLI